MYTGLVKGMGEVMKVDGMIVVIKPESYQLYEDLKLGDSVAVDGQTAIVSSLVDGQTAIVSSLEESGSSFVFKVTFYSNHAVKLNAKDVVNLERALLTTSRVEGIYMLGLVDAQGEIKEKVPEDSGQFRVTVKVSPEILKQIAPNGYLLVNGVALRVTQVDDANSTFTFELWPDTAKNTSLGKKNVESFVNIELDILSKYVEKYHYQYLTSLKE